MDAIETALRDLLQAQLRTQAQVDALAQRVEELVEAQKRTEIAVQTPADRFAKQLPRIDTAIGYVVERRYAERASAYFASIASRIRVLSRDALDDLVDQALEDRTLTRSEANRSAWRTPSPPGNGRASSSIWSSSRRSPWTSATSTAR